MLKYKKNIVKYVGKKNLIFYFDLRIKNELLFKNSKK